MIDDDYQLSQLSYQNYKAKHKKLAPGAKNPEEMEKDYASLKALHLILGKVDLKFKDFYDISFLNHERDREIEIFSPNLGIHKIIKTSDLMQHFKIRSDEFLTFLDTNGASNEAAPRKTERTTNVGYYRPEVVKHTVPKVGDYYLDAATGFWKVATKKDVDHLEGERRNSLRMVFSESLLETQES